MGALLGKCYFGKANNDRRGVLLVGLDCSGCTTILYHQLHGRYLRTIPTLGLNREIISVDGTELEVYDIGGMEITRPLWPIYSKRVNAVVYVVDSSDTTRFNQDAELLRNLFFFDDRVDSRGPIVPDIPLLILANKQDSPGAVGCDRIEEALRLEEMPVRSYKVLPTIATEGKNLANGFSWIVHQLNDY